MGDITDDDIILLSSIELQNLFNISLKLEHYSWHALSMVLNSGVAHEKVTTFM